MRRGVGNRIIFDRVPDGYLNGMPYWNIKSVGEDDE